MKLRLLLFTLLLTTIASAQQTFRAGLIAGFSGCQIHGDSYSGYRQLGYVACAFVQTNPDAQVQFVMEMQYSKKGSRKLARPNIGDYTYFELRMNYIEVPLLLRYGAKHIFIEGGASLGYLFKVREWDSYSEITPRDFKKMELSAVLGIGYRLNEKFSLDFRSVNSLLPVKKFGPILYPVWYQDLFNMGMYNNVVTLSVVYTLPNGKE
jgi:hypothetical protein